MLALLITGFVFTGYFIESIFGFGGTVLSLAAVSGIVDVKEAILIVTYASMCASACVLVSDFKSFSLTHLLRIFLFSVPGVLVGTYLFTVMASAALLKVFAVFLLLYSLYSILKPAFRLPLIVSRFVLFVAGVLQGLYATGGPFVLMGYGDKFKDKSALRTVIAGFLLFGNVLRLVQLSLMGQLEKTVFLQYWWLIFPLAVAVFLGFSLHVKIEDRIFKRGIYVLMIVAGVFYLIK